MAGRVLQQSAKAHLFERFDAARHEHFTAKFPGEVPPSLQQGDVDAPSRQQPGQGGTGRARADYDDAAWAASVVRHPQPAISRATCYSAALR